jgi:hypothetical protein
MRPLFRAAMEEFNGAVERLSGHKGGGVHQRQPHRPDVATEVFLLDGEL